MDNFTSELLDILNQPDDDDDSELTGIPQQIVDPRNNFEEDIVNEYENFVQDNTVYKPTYQDTQNLYMGQNLGGGGGGVRIWPTKEEAFAAELLKEYDYYIKDDNFNAALEYFKENIPNYYMKNPMLLILAYLLKIEEVSRTRNDIDLKLKEINAKEPDLNVNLFRYLFLFDRRISL